MSHDVYIRKIDLFIQVLDSHNGCRKIEKFSWNSFFLSVSLFKKKILSRDTWNEFLIFDLKTDVSQCLFLASEDRGGGRFRNFYLKTCQHVAMRCELPQEASEDGRSAKSSISLSRKGSWV